MSPARAPSRRAGRRGGVVAPRLATGRRQQLLGVTDLHRPRAARPRRRRSGGRRPGHRPAVLDADVVLPEHRQLRHDVHGPVQRGGPAAARRAGDLAVALLQSGGRRRLPGDVPPCRAAAGVGRTFSARPGAGNGLFPLPLLRRPADPADRLGPQLLRRTRRQPHRPRRQRRRPRRQRPLRLDADLRPVRLPPDGHRRGRLGDGAGKLRVGAAVADVAVPPPIPGGVRRAGGVAARRGLVRPTDALRPAQRLRRRPGHSWICDFHAPGWRMGDAQLDATSIAFALNLLAFLPLLGLGQAVEILVADASARTTRRRRPVPLGRPSAAPCCSPGRPRRRSFSSRPAGRVISWRRFALGTGTSARTAAFAFVAVYCLFDAASLVFSCACAGPATRAS